MIYTVKSKALSDAETVELDGMGAPKCGEEMGIVAFIEDQAVIRKILASMYICEDHERPLPRPLPRALHEYDEYECAS